MAAPLEVEVVYARPRACHVVALKLAPGTTLREAIARSGLLERFGEIDLAACAVGVFGKIRGLDEAVEAGDRIEIYRPLTADPKERRRRQARATPSSSGR